MSELLPCPFCGGTDIVPLQIIPNTNEVAQMLCAGPRGCGAHGPRVWGGGTRGQAEELWHHRAAPAGGSGERAALPASDGAAGTDALRDLVRRAYIAGWIEAGNPGRDDVTGSTRDHAADHYMQRMADALAAVQPATADGGTAAPSPAALRLSAEDIGLIRHVAVTVTQNSVRNRLFRIADALEAAPAEQTTKQEST